MAQLGPGGATCTTPSAANACLIDNLLAGASVATAPKSGYYFTVAPSASGTGYATQASPSGPGTTGTRSFCSDQNLVLFYNSTGGACATSSATPL
ncbi:MAG: hypothetical protein WCE52_14755 [Candidatus Acidiferrum sp.]